MKREVLCMCIHFEEEIRKGVSVSRIYEQIRISAERGSSALLDVGANGCGDDRRMSLDDTESANAVSVVTDDSRKVLRINPRLFGNTAEFAARLDRFLRDLIKISENLEAVDDVNRISFVDFIFDIFNSVGDIDSLMKSFKPPESAAMKRSGLRTMDKFAAIFLFQDLRSSMRMLLAFNMSLMSARSENIYIEELVSRMCKSAVSRMLAEEYDSPLDLDGSTVMSLLSGLYLLFDVFVLDDRSLKDILYIALVFSSRKGRELARFLDINSIFVCTAMFVCGDVAPLHVVLRACKEKLNMRCRVCSLGLSIGYAYSWLYRPHLIMAMPGCVAYSETPRMDAVILGDSIRAENITVEVREDRDKKPVAKGLAYSPLSRRLSCGLRGRGISGFKSKQRLTFN